MITGLVISVILILLASLYIINRKYDELLEENLKLINDINTLQSINDNLVEDQEHMMKQLKIE